MERAGGKAGGGLGEGWGKAGGELREGWGWGKAGGVGYGFVRSFVYFQLLSFRFVSVRFVSFRFVSFRSLARLVRQILVWGLKNPGFGAKNQGSGQG